MAFYVNIIADVAFTSTTAIAEQLISLLHASYCFHALRTNIVDKDFSDKKSKNVSNIKMNVFYNPETCSFLQKQVDSNHDNSFSTKYHLGLYDQNPEICVLQVMIKTCQL